jgi:hypothetical protein
MPPERLGNKCNGEAVRGIVRESRSDLLSPLVAYVALKCKTHPCGDQFAQFQADLPSPRRIDTYTIA